MKTLLHIISNILLLALVAQARTVNVFITPHLSSKTQKIEVVEEIGKLALKGIDPGDSLNIYCGETMAPVARLSVPGHRAYQNNWEERLKAMLPEYMKFKAWVVSPPKIEGKPLSLDIPRIFRFVADDLKSGKEGIAMLLIGSPIYSKSSELASSMEDCYYPSDGNLAATSRESIYGLADASDRLKGVEVHWSCLANPFRDMDHERAVERWWSLYAAHQGAVLRSSEESLVTVAACLLEKNSERMVSNDKPDLTSRVSMNQIGVRVRLPEGENSDSSLNFLQTADIETQPYPTTLVKGCRIGIRWQGKHDLDLFVRPAPNAEELFFGHNRSEKGRHLKDILTEPVGADAYELVELDGAVNLSELQVAINTYRGIEDAGDISGSVRIEINGKVYSKPFTLPASNGNKGADRGTERKASKFWTLIDPLELTGAKRR